MARRAATSHEQNLIHSACTRYPDDINSSVCLNWRPTSDSVNIGDSVATLIWMLTKRFEHLGLLNGPYCNTSNTYMNLINYK